MSDRQTTSSHLRLPDPDFVHPELLAPETPSMRAFGYVAAALRFSIGWVFLWAFLDKTFGLGHETASADAWLNGGEPTRGFLQFGAAGPFTDFYHSIAGAAWADWAFMLGLAGIGLALILGLAMRVAAAAGAGLLVLMWTVVLPPDNNLFMDDHLVYALVLVALALVGAGSTLGLGGYWATLPIVRKHAWMR